MSHPAHSLDAMSSLTVPHPWRRFREHFPHVNLHLVDWLPAGVLAATDGHSRVVMRDTLLQRERRVAIAHEMEHLEHSDACGQTPAVEDAINTKIARDLIPLGALIDAARWDRRVAVMAEELWVTEDLVTTRIQTLTDDEAATVATALE